MNAFVIIVDMRANNGHSIVPILDELDDMKVFPSEEDAKQFIEAHPLGKFPCKVVEVDD